MSTQDQAYYNDNDDTEAHDESSYPTETDYYALLNLPRSPAPTEAQIRSAYRTLVLSFHPDKQPAQWHDAAGRHFARIRAAYDTLVDPQKRAVYDLLGAEGVRAEWGPHGAMGMFGEARRLEQKGEVGVRAMAPEEFRRWFLGVMRRRERVAVNRLVQCRSSVSVGIDADGLIIVDEDDEVYLGIPTLQTNAFSIGCSFKTPVPTPRVIFGESEKEEDTDDESAEQEGESPVETEMVISAGVKGQLRHLQREGTPLPLLMIANNITLGTSINRQLDDLARPKGLFGERFSSLFTNAGCAANFLVLPAPILQAAYAKAYTPIPGTRPFTVQVSTLFKNAPFKCMPTIGLQVTKPIAQRKTVFCSWSSGTLEWPYLFERLFGLGAHADNITRDASSFQLGYTSLPQLSRSLATQADEDEDVEDDEEEDLAFEMARHQLRAQDQAAESWQTVAMASPGGGGLSVTYSRNIFSGKAANEPRRSEWSSEGHYPLPQEVEPRSVRLEIQTSLALDLSLSWVVEGTRQVGEFTRMGLGVGLTDAQGLVMTFSWSRLGQKIQVPVKICPLDSVTSDASTIALVLPWVAYCAVEFGIIRPRDRRNRRRAIAKRHRQLKKLIPKHRADSQQAIELMAEQTRRRQAREESQGGLVITKAEYGHYPSQKKKRDSEGMEPRPDEVADVTIPVAALVDRGQLVIAKDMVKFHILGFYDPAPLLSKSLKIWYLYHGKEHFVEARDGEGVACPMRSHLL